MIERGNLRYRYTIHIDLEPIVDEIMDVLGGYYDNYDFGVVGDDLQIDAISTTPYKLYKIPATILDPAEEELHVETIEHIDLQKAILEAIHRLERVRTSVEIRSEDYQREDT